MQRRVIALSTVLVMLLCFAPAFAHHSNSAYEVEKVLTLTGTVKSWKWSNPHTWLTLTVQNEKGETVDWELEGRAPGVLGRIGWDRSVLKPGEKVTVHMSPAKDGSHVGIIARVTKADGTILGNSTPNQ
jgi:Family of unknown function (DUF6152)